ncbi:MAG: DUF1345 domain-containing protein [Ktedonobacteraceae bacterium]|nr:DUF1345 domain-containing protein [Ktedonobacteraceae bacterium]
MKNIDETQPAEEQPQAVSQAPMAPRWAAILGLIAFGLLYNALPDNVTIGPNWLPLVLEVLLIVPILVSGITKRPLRQEITRALIIISLATITTALIGGVILFVVTIPNKGTNDAKVLLHTAILLWVSNILVFALWYWEVDGGGPKKRHEHKHEAADFMFPQQADGNNGRWAPHFLDYLFVAFTGATALSPADTYPLTRRAKGLMIVEALNAMVILTIIIGRIVNIL